MLRHGEASTTASVILHATDTKLWSQRFIHRGNANDVYRVAALQDLAARWALDWLTPHDSCRSHPANRVYRVSLVLGEHRSCKSSWPWRNCGSVYDLAEISSCEEYAA